MVRTLPLLRDAVILTRTISPQFSVCEFGAAITVAVQTKRATLLTKVLGTEVSLIAIGVSAFFFGVLRGYYTFSQRLSPLLFPSLLLVVDMGSERTAVRRDDRLDHDILRTCMSPTLHPKLADGR